eukprot:TRINITY_DN20447_c0_g1_i1.p1 TRINITY_DN20447_c0_g1~~TRINITY_DN20447_c0_g1_i1.p1  ORF type:complete len:368 (+),score=72.25 TRINITY_DN20447_c0_g1_i1:64-1167(+)
MCIRDSINAEYMGHEFREVLESFAVTLLHFQHFKESWAILKILKIWKFYDPEFCEKSMSEDPVHKFLKACPVSEFVIDPFDERADISRIFTCIRRQRTMQRSLTRSNSIDAALSSIGDPVYYLPRPSVKAYVTWGGLGHFTYEYDPEDLNLHKRPPLKITSLGDAYEGQWWGLSRHGRGTNVFKDGSFYEGHWRDDLPHGYGRFISKDGDIYEGLFCAGVAEGKGVYRSSNDKWIDGEWHESRLYGLGRIVVPGKFTYEGELLNGLKHGPGRLEMDDGSSFEGDFYENKKHGKGVFKWADGSSYDGGYFRDRRHGKGRYATAGSLGRESNWEYGMPMGTPRTWSRAIDLSAHVSNGNDEQPNSAVYY